MRKYVCSLCELRVVVDDDDDEIESMKTSIDRIKLT